MRGGTSWRRRRYAREEMIFDPLHYLALLEQKTHALDQAAPLAGWALPAEFAELLRQMEARLGKPGRRESVQVLRLVEAEMLERDRKAAGWTLRNLPEQTSAGPQSPARRLRSWPNLPRQRPSTCTPFWDTGRPQRLFERCLAPSLAQFS